MVNAMLNRLSKVSWLGEVALSVGCGAFVGRSGDNQPHRHWAHQVVIGLDRKIQVATKSGHFEAQGFWIPAGVRHQLMYAPVLSIYLDPAGHNWPCPSNPVCDSKQGVIPLDDSIRESYLEVFTGSGPLTETLNQFRNRFMTSAECSKLKCVLKELHEGSTLGLDVSRKTLADLTKLSPSRFSHWFSEQTGLPLRSYKKWLKMLSALKFSQEMPLTDAAVIAGFADKAHFCRAVQDAFGVTPATIANLLSEK